MRELTRADVEDVTESRGRVAAVANIRDSHHRVARLFAKGLRPSQVAEATGYSLIRIYTLSADPSFQELIAQYRNVVDEEFREVVKDEYSTLATSNMLKAERMLADKLDDADAEGNPLPTRDLIAISRDAADRFGYGKKSLSVNLNADFASMLDKAMKRSGKLIEGVVSQPAPLTPQPTSRKPPVVETTLPFRRRA